MLRFFKWVIGLGLLAGIGWVAWNWYYSRGVSGDAFSLIPEDAIYCITTDDPVRMWKEVGESSTWQHLQKNSYFASLTSTVEDLSGLVRGNDLLVDLIGSTALIASAHMTGPKDYDFLFLIDLKGASGIKFLNEYLTAFTASGYSIHKEKYKEEDIITLFDTSDKTSLYLSMPGSYLVASYTKKLITRSLDLQGSEHSSKDIFFQAEEEPGKGDKLKLYLNYAMLPQFMNCYSEGKNEYVNRLAQALRTSNFDFTIEEEMIRAKGQTSINDSIESYVKTLAASGKGATEFLEVTPQRTAFFMALGFTSFTEFFKNFEKNLQQDVTEYASYRENTKQVESYLNIDLQKNVIDWIGDEVAVIEMQSSGLGLDNETAVLLKAHNIQQALTNLDHIEKMVRRRTPVKFKTVEHRGHTIKYLGVKNFFKIILGKFFARYDKPYYTVISNFVVFSTHPQALESMIDDYLDKKTLARSDDFRSFQKEFDDEHSVFVYINTPVFFNSMKKLADVSTRSSMDTNKDFIVCFRQAGFQMIPGKDGFKTLFVEKFVEPEGAREDKEVKTLADADADLDSDEQGEPVADEPEPIVEEEAKPVADPMELPYIYVKNLNAKSYEENFPDSTVHFKVELKGGFKDGSFKEYHPNGETKMTGQFKRDKRDGTWRLYDENGKLILRRAYSEGEVRSEKVKD